MLTPDQVFLGVCEVVSEALGVDTEEVELGASLTDDLGAESIDFLDIVFRAEQKFNVKIAPGEMFGGNSIHDALEHLGLVRRDEIKTELNQHDREEFKRRLPFLDEGQLGRVTTVDEVFTLFTVEYCVRFVLAKLAEKEKLKV